MNFEKWQKVKSIVLSSDMGSRVASVVMLMKMILMLPELWGHTVTRQCWDLGDMGLGVAEISPKEKTFNMQIAKM